MITTNYLQPTQSVDNTRLVLYSSLLLLYEKPARLLDSSSISSVYPSNPDFCIIVILWAVVTEWQGFILYHHCEFELVSTSGRSMDWEKKNLSRWIFWSLESGFLMRKREENDFFSKSAELPILSFWILNVHIIICQFQKRSTVKHFLSLSPCSCHLWGGVP